MNKLLARALVAFALLGLAALPAEAQIQGVQRPLNLAIDSGTKTATAVAGAVTLAKNSGVITTEALVTAAGATYTLTITDTSIAATDLPFASVWYGTATTGTPTIAMTKPAAGSLQIIVQNISAAAALNGTLKIAFAVLKN